MSTSVNRHRYKNKLLGLPHPRHGGKHGEKSAILSTKFSYILYLHRQFNDRYINSFIINVYLRRYIFRYIFLL